MHMHMRTMFSLEKVKENGSINGFTTNPSKMNCYYLEENTKFQPLLCPILWSDC